MHCDAVAYLDRVVQYDFADSLPVLLQKVLLCVGTTLSNFLMTAFFR